MTIDTTITAYLRKKGMRPYNGKNSLGKGTLAHRGRDRRIYQFHLMGADKIGHTAPVQAFLPRAHDNESSDMQRTVGVQLVSSVAAKYSLGVDITGGGFYTLQTADSSKKQITLLIRAVKEYERMFSWVGEIAHAQQLSLEKKVNGLLR